MAKADFRKIAIVTKYWTQGVSASSLRNIATAAQSLEETMSIKIRIPMSLKTAQEFLRWMRLSTLIPAVCLLFPMAALAQGGSPFDTGFTSIQTLFTGTIAKVASLVAIVIGGYGFAHGEPGAKKALAGVAAGTGIAVLAVNVLTWLWGV
jgi:type IV secretory pathway VirB2 component (pilin)